MTLNELVNRALRLLAVTRSGEAGTGDQLVDGIEALNMMMAGLRLRGIDMGWQAYTSAQGSETLPYPDEDAGFIASMLAVHLSPEYGKGLSIAPQVIEQSETGRMALWAKYASQRELRVDDALSAWASEAVDRTLFS